MGHWKPVTLFGPSAYSCVALLLVCYLDILLVPYTKVEETFSLHVVYDLLYYGPAKQTLQHVRPLLATVDIGRAS